MTSRSSICVFCGHGYAPADLPDHAEWPASGQTESARDQGELLVADGEGRRRIGTAYGHVLSGLDIARRQRDIQPLLPVGNRPCKPLIPVAGGIGVRAKIGRASCRERV